MVIASKNCVVKTGKTFTIDYSEPFSSGLFGVLFGFFFDELVIKSKVVLDHLIIVIVSSDMEKGVILSIDDILDLLNDILTHWFCNFVVRVFDGLEQTLRAIGFWWILHVYFIWYLINLLIIYYCSW